MTILLVPCRRFSERILQPIVRSIPLRFTIIARLVADGEGTGSLVPILTMRFLANIKRAGVQDQTGASGLRLSTVPFAGGTQTDRLLQHITGNVQFSDAESENEYSTDETIAELNSGEAAPENISGPQSTSDVV